MAMDSSRLVVSQSPTSPPFRALVVRVGIGKTVVRSWIRVMDEKSLPSSPNNQAVSSLAKPWISAGLVNPTVSSRYVCESTSNEAKGRNNEMYEGINGRKRSRVSHKGYILICVTAVLASISKKAREYHDSLVASGCSCLKFSGRA